MKKPELLAPAGTLKNARYALAYGADAVYAGMPRYSLRVRNNDFLQENLAIGIAETHALGRAFYLACNVMPHGAKLKTFLEDLQPVIEMGPDALIMSDPGLILMVREAWPEMPVHLSVQANTMNAESVRFWQRQGLARVILSRELSLDEVAQIRQACPDMELEVFVHGALCIAYSGRCLLSGYFNHRDANQGTCTNSCRWDYKVSQPADGPELSQGPGGVKRHPQADGVYYLEEPNRPGEQMPVYEDEHGTYIMNSKDLRAVEHVSQLVSIGVDCLKIEGRTKSHYYTARTTQVYRQAIDDAVAGRPFQLSLMADLESLANRGYTDGFYQRHESQELQNYRYGSSQVERQQFVAEVVDEEPQSDGLVRVDVKNKLRIGDRLELMSPSGNYDFVLEQMQDLQGVPMQEAPGGGYRVQLALPVADVSHGLLCRYLGRS
jgi:putative protease